MGAQRSNILAGLIVTIALVAAACAGGSKTAVGGGGNGTNPGVEVPAIQVQHQSAFALLDAAGWSTALGDQVTAIEDDLMAPTAGCGGSSSGASTLTASGSKFVVFLEACDNEADAQSLSTQIASQPPVVTVQQCTKVINIRPSLGPEAQAALDGVKANGGDPTAAFQQSNDKLAAQATKLADALKARVSCDPGKAVYEIPAGGADPCDVASLSAALGESVIVSHQLANRGNPGVSCRVTPKTKPSFTLTLSCDAQLKKAVPPTNADSAFATEQHNQGSRATAVTDGGIEAFHSLSIFESKLRKNGTVCRMIDEVGQSAFDDPTIADAIRVVQGLAPRFVDKDQFLTEGGGGGPNIVTN
jgi:hypothetical protein